MIALPSEGSRDQKHKALAEYWVGRFMIEKNIKSLKDVDPVECSIWLQDREKPSIGQKRNIATAIKKHFGIKLLAMCSPPREVHEIVKPSVDIFNKTLFSFVRAGEIKKLEDCDNYSSFIEMACFAFICTSITGLSIVELSRSKISYKDEKYKYINNEKIKTYDLTLIVDAPDDCKIPERLTKNIHLINLIDHHIHCIENLPKILNLDGEYSLTQMVSKLQYIIGRHNQAKGYSLRSLRSMYPGILGFIKPEG